MAKYPPKLLDNESNQRTSIHRNAKVERPKKLQKQSSQKTEAKKVNSVIEKLDKSDVNIHGRKTNINYL